MFVLTISKLQELDSTKITDCERKQRHSRELRLKFGNKASFSFVYFGYNGRTIADVVASWFIFAMSGLNQKEGNN